MIEVKVFLGRIDERLKSLADDMKDVAKKSDIHSQQITLDSHRDKISALEKNQSRVVWTVISGVIVAILGAIGIGTKKIGL